MSLFNFFKGNKKTEDSMNTSVSLDIPVVDQALFVDDNKPDLDDRSGNKRNSIEEFLDQDFEFSGYHEGYAYPDADHLDYKIREIRAGFRLAVDKLLDATRNGVSDLRIHLIKTDGISPRLNSQLLEKLKLLEANIHELDMQKILSVEDEGMIGPAIHSFRLGFRKGIDRYQQEKFIAGSTGLFNK